MDNMEVHKLGRAIDKIRIPSGKTFQWTVDVLLQAESRHWLRSARIKTGILQAGEAFYWQNDIIAWNSYFFK